jgi:N-formylmaleamate deformylase
MSDRVLTQPALADLAEVQATSRWVTGGDLRLHVLDYGGDGVPLVMLPGITSPAITMDFVARELTGLARPIVVDVRGRGLSDDGDSYTLADYACDTEAIVTGLALDRPVLFGHSMGARIAAVTAAKVPVRGTVLVDPPMSGPGRDPYPTTLEMFLGQLAEARRGTTPAGVARWWPSWPERELQLRARWLASCGEKAVAETHHGFETEDFFDHWPALGARAVLLYGGNSPVVTAAGVREAAGANPRATLVEIPDAGHMVFWDNPPGALAAVREVLRSIVEER